MSPAVKILPSLLAADFGRLEEGARKAEACGGDALHVDIMDGHFVPNLSMGPDVVRMAARTVRIPLSVHLMMTRPADYVERFVRAGSSSLLIHIEAQGDIAAALGAIRALGARAGITLNPETPAEKVFPVLEAADEVLCMTVRPGYGGQKFMPDVLPKIRALRDRLSLAGRDTDILVDGGIARDTAALCAAHGANAFVAGVALYGATDMAAEVRILRERAEQAFRP